MIARSTRTRGQGRYQQPRWLQSLLHARGILLFCGLAVLLSACTNTLFAPTVSHGSPDTTGNAPASPTSVVSPTPTPVPRVINLQVVGSCPSINWDSLVGTHAHVNKVQKVVCGNVEGGAFAAVVGVGYYSSDARLDGYVYDNLSGTPNRRFTLQGLLDGDIGISPANTLMTAEIGPDDSVKTVPDVFKEYQWNGSTFVQVLSPYLFPDMTQYQAEQSQARVASGLDTWKLSPTSEAAHLAQDIFHWSAFTLKTVIFSQTQNIVSIAVTNQAPGGGGFYAVFHHLDGVATNIYEAGQVSSIDGNALLTSPTASSTLTSPVSVSGSYVVNGSLLGHVELISDNYLTIGDSGAIHSSVSSGLTSFTASVSYHLNAHGLEEGAVAFLPTSQNNLSLSNQAVMVKVFFSA